jgi:hypothetical protein
LAVLREAATLNQAGDGAPLSFTKGEVVMRHYLPQTERNKSVMGFVTVVAVLAATFATLLYLGMQ